MIFVQKYSFWKDTTLGQSGFTSVMNLIVFFSRTNFFIVYLMKSFINSMINFSM